MGSAAAPRFAPTTHVAALRITGEPISGLRMRSITTIQTALFVCMDKVAVSDMGESIQR